MATTPSHLQHASVQPRHGQVQQGHDLNTPEEKTRKELLRDAFFPNWSTDASNTDDLADPQEMQKKDPIGIQVWKLYSRTKKQLPNQERMDNLTWRMMSMNLKRREMEQAR